MRVLKQKWHPVSNMHSVVTTQAHEGIETLCIPLRLERQAVTTQAHEGIETSLNLSLWGNLL